MLLRPPIPAPVSFHNLFQDPTGAHTGDLQAANQARARVRTVIKAASKEGGADWAAATRATTEYLPYLYAILVCVETDDLLLTQEPIFTWRTTLSTQLLKKSNPRVSLPSLCAKDLLLSPLSDFNTDPYFFSRHYELSATLLSHALCLSNHASTLIASLGTYETSRSVSSEDLKVHDETVNSAAALLCQASGVLSYLAEVVIPRWESAVGEGIKGRPIELGRDVVTALSKLTLADANLLGIRRLLSRSVSTSSTTSTPGPPLSSSHPSPSLLAKLHLNVYALYDTSRSLVKTASRTSSDGRTNGKGTASNWEVIPELRRYLSDGRLISLSLSYKWLGIDAGENGARPKAGECLAWLGMAKEGLEEVKGKSKGIKGMGVGMGMGKGNKGGKERKGKVEDELSSVGAFLSAYKRVNDSLHFQPVPSATSLQPFVPAGRAILTVKPFAPPAVAFPLRKRDDESRYDPLPPAGFNDLDASRIDLDADSSDDERGGGGDEAKATYFGNGSYW